MRRRIGQPVRRHHPVETTAPHPVIDVPIFLLVVDKFDPGARRHQKALGRFRNVTSVMKPVGLHIGGELFLHIPSARIPPGVNSAVLSGGQGSGPHQASHHEQILQGLISGRIVLGLPKCLPTGQVETLHLAIAASI